MIVSNEMHITKDVKFEVVEHHQLDIENVIGDVIVTQNTYMEIEEYDD